MRLSDAFRRVGPVEMKRALYHHDRAKAIASAQPAMNNGLPGQAARIIPRKSLAFSDAPPTNAPPTSSACRISAAFEGFTEPP